MTYESPDWFRVQAGISLRNAVRVLTGPRHAENRISRIARQTVVARERRNAVIARRVAARLEAGETLANAQRIEGHMDRNVRVIALGF